ncbi:MAG TPA: hypothetical protein EYG93_03105 [Sulfurospirillum arcachonense]|nr:hypothetical protein [Sulfurospirillum arcachonense]
MKKTILFVCLVFVWVVILFPKVILWDYFVDEIQKKDITITAKKVDIKIWLAYNQIEIKDLTALKTFKVDSLEIKQTIFDPLHVDIYGTSKYGDFSGKIELVDKKGYILFEKSDLKNAIFKGYFKKVKEGMKYEFSY